jgi:hypothetical protein
MAGEFGVFAFTASTVEGQASRKFLSRNGRVPFWQDLPLIDFIQQKHADAQDSMLRNSGCALAR